VGALKSLHYCIIHISTPVGQLVGDMLKTLLLVLAAQPALPGALKRGTSAVPGHLDAEALQDILVGLQAGGRGLVADDAKAVEMKNAKDQRAWQAIEKTDLGRKWDEYQAALARDISTGPGKGQLKVLVVTAVADHPREAMLLEDSLKRLVATSPGQGDVFHWALFHHDNSTYYWDNFTFTNPARNGENVVVFNHVGPGCKAQNWNRLPQELTDQYDYIWLMDSDLRLDFFRWDLYRAVLTKLNPLVSQPSILPPFGGGMSTAIKYLPIHSSCGEGFPVAMELPRSEVQAILISTKIWPAVRTRMRNGPLTTVWFMDAYWDAIAQIAKDSSCGQVAPVLVNAAPVWHQHWKTLGTQVSSNCPTWKGAGAAQREVSSDEFEEVKAALLGIGCKDTELKHGWEVYFQNLFSSQARQGERMCDLGLCRKWVDGGAHSLPHMCFTDGLEFARTEFAKRGMVTPNDTEHLLGGLQVGLYTGVPATTNGGAKR